MKENAGIHAVLTWARTQDTVRAVVLTGDRVNRAAVRRPGRPYLWIIGCTDPHGAREAFPRDRLGTQQILFAGEEYREEREIPLLYLLTEKRTRHVLRFFLIDHLFDVLSNDTLTEVLLDRDARFGARSMPTDLSHRTRRPKPACLQALFEHFFSGAIDTGFALQHGESLRAQYLMQFLQTDLLEMAQYATAARYDFTINLGEYGAHLGAYMDAAFLEHFRAIFTTTEPDAQWDALFQACMLFRKFGLSLQEKVDFQYPRREDVSVLQLLRSLWEETK